MAPAKKQLKSAHAMSATDTKRMVAQFNRHLKEQGFDAVVQEVHLLPRGEQPPPAPVPLPALAGTLDCPPPRKIKRVCQRQPDGTILCQNVCV